MLGTTIKLKVALQVELLRIEMLRLIAACIERMIGGARRFHVRVLLWGGTPGGSGKSGPPHTIQRYYIFKVLYFVGWFHTKILS